MQDVWPCLVKVEEYLGCVLYMVVKSGCYGYGVEGAWRLGGRQNGVLGRQNRHKTANTFSCHRSYRILHSRR